MKYNKVYFLHIPKTGGRFLNRYILTPIEQTLNNNGIELVKSNQGKLFDRQHAGWPSWIDDKTYIISVFREPCEFFVSAVCHAAADQNGLIDRENWHIVKNNGNDLVVDKQEIDNALFLWKYINNFQSQNFILDPGKNNMSIFHAAMSNYENSGTIDKEELYSRINRVNLMIRHSDLKSMDYSILINKISNDLKINIELDTSNLNRQHFKNDASSLLFKSLNQEDKDYILQSFEIDKEIYENDSLFWNINR